MKRQKAEGRRQKARSACVALVSFVLLTAVCLLPTALRAQGTNARSEQSGNGAPTGNCSVFANDYSQVRVDRATGKHYNCVGTPGTNTGTWVEATAAAGAVLNTRQVLTTSPLSGGGDLSADRTFTCPTCEVTTRKDAASGYAGLDASARLKTAEFPAFTGDITTTAGGVVSVLKNTGAAGTYRSATFDAQGRETSGTNPTTFSGYAISDTISNFFVAVPGPVPEASGGTGSNVTTGASGHYLRSNATHYVDSAIQAGDVPTLNQNTTGTAGGLTNASALSIVTTAANANITITPNGSGVISLGRAIVAPNNSLTDNGSTIATDASLSNNFRVTALTANVTLSNPTNSTDGQVVTWEVIQNASTAKTLAFGINFAFGGEITGCTISTTLSSHSFITAIYNSTTTKWYIRGCVTGY